MNRNWYWERHKFLNIRQEELERKYRLHLYEQEQQFLAMAIASAGGRGSSNSDLTSIIVKDFNLLPSTDKQIISIIFDGDEYLINDTFQLNSEIVNYLNYVFVIDNDLQGSFYVSDGNLIYTNPEKFDNSEIMAILKPTTLIFSMGAPPAVPNEEYTAISNSNFIQDERINGKIIAIRIGNMNIEPLNIDGYKQTGTRVDFNGPNLDITNSNIYIQIIQTT